MSDHDQPVAANLLDRNFTAAAPNQRWVGDTTEFVIGGRGKLYLAAILDLFSRFIVGWAVRASNDRQVTIKALQMALKRRCPDAGLVHHSDQGCTYASEDYQDVLDTHGITCSMSRRGHCYDNAVMESFFSTVKSELREHFESTGEAKMELFDCRHYRPCWTPYVAHEGGRWCPRPSTISGGRGRYSTTPLSTATSGRPAVTSASPAPCFTSGGARIRVRETPGSSTSARALGLTPMRPRLRWSN